MKLWNDIIGDSMAFLIVIVSLAIFVFIAKFVMDNLDMFQQTFAIHFNLPYLGHYTSRPIQFMYMIALSVLVGALATGIPGWLANSRLRGVVRKQRKEIENLQRELESLRQPPVETRPLTEPTLEEKAEKPATPSDWREEI